MQQITLRRLQKHVKIVNLLKIAPTATGSVAAKIAPNNSASRKGTAKIKPMGIPIKNIVAITPMIAKNPMGTDSFFICPNSNFRPASKIKRGMKTSNIKLENSVAKKNHIFAQSYKYQEE